VHVNVAQSSRTEMYKTTKWCEWVSSSISRCNAWLNNVTVELLIH